MNLNGYGFPFDRSHLIFYNKRLKTAKSIVENLSTKKKKNKYIIKLNRVIARAINDRNLKTVVIRMEEKVQIFDQMKKVLRKPNLPSLLAKMSKAAATL